MIKLGIIGTGGMANAQAQNFSKIKNVKIVAACDIIDEKVKDFAEQYNIPKTFTDIDDMLENAEIDAVSNVTPDAFHAPISLKVIESGKHILCEKPLATNYPDAKKMADAANAKGVINMVNFSYRNSSAIQKAHKIIEKGEIGRVMHVEACYLQSWLSSKGWGDWHTKTAWLWRLSKSHGSLGVLGDVGVHIVDFTSFPAGKIKSVNCKLKTFHKAENDKIGEYNLDANDSAIISVEFKNGAIGTIHTTRWATGYQNTLELRIFGDKGAIRINLDKAYDKLEICCGENIHESKWETIDCGKTPNIYERFINSILTGENDQPDFARGAEIQKILDACVESDETKNIIEV